MSKRPFSTHLIVLLAGSLAAVVLLAAVATARGGASRAQVQSPTTAHIADIAQRGTMHTIVIDPGHGGDDDGVRGLNGAKEKDVVFQIAQSLKTAIETRLQIKVLLTRESDETVTVDARAVFANTNKADLFLSLHANASVRPELRGTEVITLSPDDYIEHPAPPPPTPKGKAPVAPPPPPPQIPVVGGGVRVLEPVMWELAQLPYVDKSAMFSATLVKHLTDRHIPSNTPLVMSAPARVLVGANMPAVLIELGFLTNADDEAGLSGTAIPNEIIEAILDTIGDVRFGFPTPSGVSRTK